MRQALLNNFLSKDIDQYGLLHLTKAGNLFIENPYSIRFAKPGNGPNR
jgi:ATP-dependent DNA helicase RecQ